MVTLKGSSSPNSQELDFGSVWISADRRSSGSKGLQPIRPGRPQRWGDCFDPKTLSSPASRTGRRRQQTEILHGTGRVTKTNWTFSNKYIIGWMRCVTGPTKIQSYLLRYGEEGYTVYLWRVQGRLETPDPSGFNEGLERRTSSGMDPNAPQSSPILEATTGAL